MTQLRFDFAVDDEGLLVKSLREGTREGRAARDVAAQLRVPPEKAQRAARRAGIRYKHQHQTPEAIERAIALVVKRGLTVRGAALASGLSKTAVHRFVLKRRQKMVDAAGTVKFETASQGSRKPKSWRCAVHGPVTVWPCVACLAEESK